jgi:hypothetical protein
VDTLPLGVPVFGAEQDQEPAAGVAAAMPGAANATGHEKMAR